MTPTPEPRPDGLVNCPACGTAISQMLDLATANVLRAVNSYDALREALEAAVEYQGTMAALCEDYRNDWSNFDGRTLRREEREASEGFRAAVAALRLAEEGHQ